MITIYHAPRSRSLRVVWLMEELGEEYRIEKVGIPLPDDFRAMAPLATLPAIEDEGIVMCESLAILQYITGRRVPASLSITTGPSPDPADYATHLQWLHFGEADLATPIGAVFRTNILAPKGERDNATVRDLLAQVALRLGHLDRHLADGREWITGAKFTIADISIGYAFLLAEFGRIPVELPTNVVAYWQRLQGRAAYQRALLR